MATPNAASALVSGGILEIRRQWYLHTIGLPTFRRWFFNPDTSDLCATCKQVDFQAIYSAQGQLSIDRSPLFLGHLDDIRSRESCAFCRLLSRPGLSGGWPSTTVSGGPTRCFLFREPFGTFHNEDFSIKRTSYRLVVATRDPTTTASGPKSDEKVFRIELQLLSDDARLIGNSPLFHGRLMNPSGIDIALVRKWIHMCQVDHSVSCAKREWKFLLPKPRRLRMIDVRHMRICDAPDDAQYLALSYRWGDSTMLRLLLSNFDNFARPGALKNMRVPKTIRDAMHLTAKLGERYLWVDALCIIQDSNEDKALQMMQMERVYGSALMTIVAAAGDDADAGLPGVEHGSRKTAQEVTTIGGLRMVISLPFLRDQLGQSSWNRRGWTFQERLLSTRSLVFTDDQVYFQCHKDVWSEDILAEDYDEGSTAARAQGSRLLFYDRAVAGNSSRVVEFRNIVAEYTTRNLTVMSDVFNALAGLANVFRTWSGQPVLYGIPEADFEDGLLWQPQRALSRRVSPDAEFPSWSWGGWVGPVRWVRETNYSVVDEWYLWCEDGSMRRLNFVRDGSANMENYYSERYTTFARVTAPGGFLDNHQAHWRPSATPVAPLVAAGNYKPGHLVFYTSSAFFTITGEENLHKFWFFAGEKHTTLSRLWIFGTEGRKVGSLVVERGSVWMESRFSQPLEFIVVSGGWERGHVLFDDNDIVFFYNVMLVEWHDGIAHRVAAGKIRQDAWKEAGPTMKLVTLG